MKLINDLLKSPSGKYSRKSIIIMIVFLYTLGIGLYITVEDKSTSVFDSCMLFLIALLGISVADKKILNKSVPNTTEEETAGTEL